MTGFHRRQRRLWCDDVPVTTIADAVGTPAYVYSAGLVRTNVRAFERAFDDLPVTLHYALKANSNLAVVRLLRELGCRVDANSIGEIDVALRAGYAPDDILFTGVGKTTAELDRAVDLGLRSINAESRGEIERIDVLARARGKRARVALRVNPDIDALSHPHISTGRRIDKFGVPLEEASEIGLAATGLQGVDLVGLHVHIGSQMRQLEPIRLAAGAVVRLAGALRAAGVPIAHVDLGGGLGIPYDGSAGPTVDDYAAAIKPVLAGAGLEVLLEPGRVLVGPAGALVTRVVDLKPGAPGRLFVVLDGGMTEMLRPALYGAYHRIEPLEAHDRPEIVCDFVGPLCESSDTVGTERRVARPAVGDDFAVMDAGAYGFVMASNYNRRPTPPEVLVDGDTWRLVRRRQTIDDLLACEQGLDP